MKITRGVLTGLTASFRDRLCSSTVFLTYEFLPLSSLVGILVNAVGHPLSSDSLMDLKLGYTFSHQGKGKDLEKVYMLPSPFKSGQPVTPNVRSREMLFRPNLEIYVAGGKVDWNKVFRKPANQLVLGTSTDLCKVAGVEEWDIDPVKSGTVGNTIVPKGIAGAVGEIYSLPVLFSISANPRSIIKQDSFVHLSKPREIFGEGVYLLPDGRSIYMHSFNEILADVSWDNTQGNCRRPAIVQ